MPARHRFGARLMIAGLVGALSTAGTGSVIAPSATAATVPMVTAVSPSSGALAGGTTVTVSGTGLSGATKVAFGKNLGTNMTVKSDTTVTVTSPAAARSGTVDVRVTTPGGTSSPVSGDAYTYSAPPSPTVTGLTPASGPAAGGTTVSVTGTGFAGVTKVSFGKKIGTGLVVSSAGQLSVSAPATARPGAVDVRVTTPAGTSTIVAADQYTYLAQTPAPTVTGVAPSSGPTAGGTAVALTGTGFTGTSGVRFGGVAGTQVSVTSSTSLSVVSPAQSGGAVDITVTTPAGTSTSGAADIFTYSAPSVTDHCGSVTGTQTWAAGTVHRLTCNVLVASGSSLTVSAGAIVKAKKFGLTISGSLDVQGTSAQPAVFTSLADDGVGGDTNGDGGATVASTGDWQGITGTAGAAVRIRYATIVYGKNVDAKGATVAQIVNSTVAHSKDTCINVSESGFRGNTSAAAVQLTDNTISDCAGAGIVVDTTGFPGSLSPTVARNSVTTILTRAINLTGSALDGALLTGNSAAGTTGTPAMMLSGTEIGVLNVSVDGIPIIVGDLTIAPGATMSVGSGSVIKSLAGEISVGGTLTASGTSSRPVVFTSLNDDSQGGDLQHNGQTYGFNGDWEGIGAGSHASLNLDNVLVDYSDYGIEGNNTSAFVVTESEVYDSIYGGISVSVDRSHETSGSAAVNVSDNFVQWDYYSTESIDVSTSGTAGNPSTVAPSPTVSGNRAFCDVEDQDRYLGCSDVLITVNSENLDFDKLAGNSVGGYGGVGPEIDGTVTADSTIDSSFSEIDFSALTVATGVTLTTTGAKFRSTDLIVDGTLDATSTQFASYTEGEPSEECDCPQPQPEAGEWGGITARPGSNLIIDDSYIGYAVEGVAASGNSQVEITNSNIANSEDAGIDISGAVIPPMITGNAIYSSDENGSPTGSDTIDITDSAVNLATVTGNSGDQAGIDGVVLTNDTQTVSGSAVFPVGSDRELIPVLSGCGSALTIPSGIFLTLGASTTIKVQCAQIQVNGSLTTAGTRSQPVVLTSLKDDSVGGDTNSDGSASTPVPHDWAGLVHGPHGTTKLTYTQLRYS